MAVAINKNGDVIITLKKDSFSAIEKLEQQRHAVYDAICQRNEEFIGNEVNCGLVEFLKETEPSYEQWQELLKKPSEN